MGQAPPAGSGPLPQKQVHFIISFFFLGGGGNRTIGIELCNFVLKKSLNQS